MTSPTSDRVSATDTIEEHRQTCTPDPLQVDVRRSASAIALVQAPIVAPKPSLPPCAQLIEGELADAYRAQFVALADGVEHLDLEFSGPTFAARRLDYSLHWAPAGSDGEGAWRVVVTIADISAMKAAERKLGALVRSKDRLVASVSHELRTPITAVMGMAYELRDRGALFQEAERNQLIALIADQSQESSHIVDDLLVAARDESEALVIVTERLPVATVIDQVNAGIGPDAVLVVDVEVWAHRHR